MVNGFRPPDQDFASSGIGDFATSQVNEYQPLASTSRSRCLRCVLYLLSDLSSGVTGDITSRCRLHVVDEARNAGIATAHDPLRFCLRTGDERPILVARHRHGSRTLFAHELCGCRRSAKNESCRVCVTKALEYR